MGDVHTNTIEGFWSLVKRGIGGVYHSVSQKYLQSYLDEYSFRYNRRDQGNLIFNAFLKSVAERADSPLVLADRGMKPATQVPFQPRPLWMDLNLDSPRVVRFYLAGMNVCPPCVFSLTLETKWWKCVRSAIRRTFASHL